MSIRSERSDRRVQNEGGKEGKEKGKFLPVPKQLPSSSSSSDRLRGLRCYEPAAVADGVLRLDGEEEARGEVDDAGGARHEALVGDVYGIEVAVHGEGQVPDAGKYQPAGSISHAEVIVCYRSKSSGSRCSL